MVEDHDNTAPRPSCADEASQPGGCTTRGRAFRPGAAASTSGQARGHHQRRTKRRHIQDRVQRVGYHVRKACCLDAELGWANPSQAPVFIKPSGAAHPGRAPLPGTRLNPGQCPPRIVLDPRPRARPRARPRVRLTHRQVDTVSASTSLTRARWHRCDTYQSHNLAQEGVAYGTSGTNSIKTSLVQRESFLVL